MKKSAHIQHPQQEDKSGTPPYASNTRLNSSTNKTITPDVNLPEGAESRFKDKLLKLKGRRRKNSSSRRAKQ